MTSEIRPYRVVSSATDPNTEVTTYEIDSPEGIRVSVQVSILDRVRTKSVMELAGLIESRAEAAVNAKRQA